MNQMEAFKWEQKQLSAVAKDRDRTGNREHEEEERRAKERREREKKERDERDKQEQRERELDELEKLLHEQAGRLVPELLTESGLFSSIDETAPTNVPTVVSKRDGDSDSPPTNESLATSLIESTSIESPSTSYTRAVPPRSDSSESIYAFIIRRLNALEGNSSLVARYIEEQAKVMRSMLKQVQVGWDEWKGEWEDEDRGRWQQEVRPVSYLCESVAQLF